MRTSCSKPVMWLTVIWYHPVVFVLKPMQAFADLFGQPLLPFPILSSIPPNRYVIIRILCHRKNFFKHFCTWPRSYTLVTTFTDCLYSCLFEIATKSSELVALVTQDEPLLSYKEPWSLCVQRWIGDSTFDTEARIDVLLVSPLLAGYCCIGKFPLRKHFVTGEASVVVFRNWFGRAFEFIKAIMKTKDSIQG